MLLLVETDDVDGVGRRAVDEGAEVEMPIQEMVWASATASSGIRSGTDGRSPRRARS